MWGFFTFVLILIGVNVDDWTVKIICAVLGGTCIMKAKRNRTQKLRAQQQWKDLQAKEIQEKLAAVESLKQNHVH